MESLGQLNTALPPNELAEQAHASSFRQAALSITALFKQGKRATTKAYIAGQRQALQEVLEFMQAMLDHPGANQGGVPSHSGLAAGTSGGLAATTTTTATTAAASPLGQVDGARLINFICARQEALKAEEEDYDEEEATGPGSGSTAVPPRRAASAAPTAPAHVRPTMSFGTRSEGATRATSPTPRTATALPTTRSMQPTAGPTASGSSAPPSPTSSLAFSPPFTRSAGTLFRPTTLAPSSTSNAPSLLHAHLAPPASPSPLSSTSLHHGNPPSPLGRPSRVHRDHHARDHHGGHHRARGSNRSNSSAVSSLNSGAASKSGAGTSASLAGSVTDEVASAGVKRRWAREAMGVGAVGLGMDDGAGGVVEVHPSGGRDHYGARDEDTSAGASGMDIEPMADLEGWDGIGERPTKRTMRTARPSTGSEGSTSIEDGEQAFRRGLEESQQ